YILEKQREKEKQREPQPKKNRKSSRKSAPKKPEYIKIPEQLMRGIKEVKETLEGILYNPDLERIEKIEVQDLAEKLAAIEEPIKAIVFDGIISQRLIDIAEEKGVEYLIGVRKTEITKKPLKLNIIEFNQVKLEENKKDES
ncbi:MAG: hypothetical protein ACTSVY_01235, partial [Candidatus Helarchaeota archaeon]